MPSQPPQPPSPTESPSCIRITVNGQTHALDNPDPNRTLLAYLRETLALTGTKEGCAEGDCGACTVVLSEPHGGGVRRRAVNACIQLLPTLHGKAVTTVEGVAGPGARLHPVQQAMVDGHASQCGFCTPGFVMSLQALLEARPDASRDEIECALAGNLCRCTGYRPIVDAARQAGAQCAKMGSTCHAQPAAAAVASQDGVALQSQGHRYWAPTTLEAFAALRMAHPEARILAGGTDLALTLTKKRTALPALLYIGRVEALCRVERCAGHLEIGAAASLSDAFEPLVEQYPELAEWARRFASTPIRNAGTLGGNIGNGSPIGDSMPVLMVLGASLVLRRGSETREVPLDAFYTGYQRNVLGEGEFIERIRIPLRDPRLQVRAYKISKRFDQDISAVCGAFSVVCEAGTVQQVRVAFGGMAATPSRAPRCEAALQNARWDAAAVHKAMAALDEDFEPIDDMRASKAYRRLVARQLLQKFHLETTGADRISVLDEEVFA